jgi:hypothetical protein
VFEDRVLRGIFGARREEVTGEWRRLHNEELYILYCSPNIIRWAVHVARMEQKSSHRVLVWKPELKSSL